MKMNSFFLVLSLLLLSLSSCNRTPSGRKANAGDERYPQPDTPSRYEQVPNSTDAVSRSTTGGTPVTDAGQPSPADTTGQAGDAESGARREAVRNQVDPEDRE